MKRLYIGFNALLIMLIVASLFLKPTHINVKASNESKSITTSSFNGIQLRRVAETEETNSVDSTVVKLEKDLSSTVAKSSFTDVLETINGSLSAYGPDCKGCSGRLGGGYDARGGNYTYNDKQYGTIRVVAGDPKYPYGTIVRIKGIGKDFLAIVLDRGGAIGINRRFTFDLLCPSEASASSYGSHRGVTFEILRYGY